MSELKGQIQARLKEAMKARDKETVTTLRGLSAAVKQYEVDTREEADDERVLTIIQKEVKKVRDSLGFAEDQDRQDLIEQHKRELVVLQEFLGKQLSEDELKSIIKELIDGGADSIGPIMGQLNQKYKGQFEGRTASQIAKDLLSS